MTEIRGSIALLLYGRDYTYTFIYILVRVNVTLSQSAVDIRLALLLINDLAVFFFIQNLALKYIFHHSGPFFSH